MNRVGSYAGIVPEVEMELYNGKLNGFINFSKIEEDVVQLNLDFNASDEVDEYAKPVFEVVDLEIPKHLLIEFCKQTLSLLEDEKQEK